MIYPCRYDPLRRKKRFCYVESDLPCLSCTSFGLKVQFLPSMHEIIFSRSVSHRNRFLAYFEGLKLRETFYNIFVCVFAIFSVHRDPSCVVSTVIIICDGGKQFSRRFILFQAFCCGFQQPVLDS